MDSIEKQNEGISPKKLLVIGLPIIVLLLILSVVFLHEPEKNAVKSENPHANLEMGEAKPNSANVSENVKNQLSELEQKVNSDPRDTVSMLLFADLLAASHKTIEAENVYKRILMINPKRTDIWIILTGIYYDKQDLKTAENYAKEALKTDAKSFEAMYNLGAVYASQGKKEEAKQLWKRVISESKKQDLVQFAKDGLSRL